MTQPMEAFYISDGNEVIVKNNKKRKRCLIGLLAVIAFGVVATAIIVPLVILTRPTRPTATTISLPRSTTTTVTSISTVTTSEHLSNATVLYTPQSILTSSATVPTAIFTETIQLTKTDDTTFMTSDKTPMAASTTIVESSTTPAVTSTTRIESSTVTVESSTTSITSSFITTPNQTIACNLAVFNNGGFESGNFSGWTNGGGNRMSINTSAIRLEDYFPGGLRYDSTIANAQFSVVPPGPDPTLPSQILNIVRTGNYALRIGDITTGGNAAVISQQIDHYFCGNIYFSWLAVLEASHPVEEASILIIELRDITKGDTPIRRIYNAPDTPPAFGSPFQNTTTGDRYYYTNWQTERLVIDPSRRGDSFLLTVFAADCSQSGHLGYVYLDNFGGLAP